MIRTTAQPMGSRRSIRERSRRMLSRATREAAPRCTLAEPLESRVLLAIGPVGEEFAVNLATDQSQQAPAVAMDLQGNYVVAWESYEQDGHGWGVYARVFGAGGTPQGPEFRVNVTTPFDQRRPDVAMDGAGNIVFVWESYCQANTSGLPDIYARLYSLQGNPLTGELLVNEFCDYSQSSPTVAMDANGDFVVAWQSKYEDGDGYGIYARRFGSGGSPQGSGFRVNAGTSGDQVHPAVAMDNAGDFVVAWEDGAKDSPGTHWIESRRYDAAGIAKGTEMLVSPDTLGGDSSPDVALASDGDHVVTWSRAGANGRDVYFRHYGAGGVVAGQVGTVDSPASVDQNDSSVAMFSDERFIVTWTRWLAADQSEIYAQPFDAAGAAEGDGFSVSTSGSALRQGPAIAMDGVGQYVIAWTSKGQDGSEEGVYARQYAQLVAPATVSGIVWQDVNHDGGRQAGEPAMGGIGVRLYTAYGAVAAETTTANDGTYRFENVRPVAGGYWIQVIPPAELAFTLPHQGQDDMVDSDVDPLTWRIAGLALTPGQVAGGYDAGLVPAATVEGVAYVDLDADGTRDAIESGLAGRTMYVDLNVNGRLDSGETSTSTGADGGYLLGSLPAGTYRIAEASRYPWRVIAPQDGFQTVTLGPEEHRTGVDFGNKALSALARAASPEQIMASGEEYNQAASAVAADAEGNCVVVWQRDYRTPGVASDLLGQLYTADGVARGSTFLIASGISGPFEPDVAMDSDGDFVVVWQMQADDGSGSVFFRRFTAGGSPAWGATRVGTYATMFQWNPAVAMDPAGNFVVAWEASTGSGDNARMTDIRMQRYAASGSPLSADIVVNTDTNCEKHGPAVAVGSSGDFVVAWGSWYQDCTCGPGVYAKRFNAAGAVLPGDSAYYDGAQNGEFQVNSWTSGWQWNPAVAMADDGSFVIAWESDSQDADYSTAVIARRYAADGLRVGEEFIVNSYYAGRQGRPDVAMDPAGGFVVTWESEGQDGSGTSLYYQQFYSTGRPAGGERQVSSTSVMDQQRPAMAMDGSGSFIVTWRNGLTGPVGSGDAGQYDIRMRRFERDVNTASVGGVVWDDVDADGVQDSGEGGIEDVEVHLLTEAGAWIATTRTTAGGAYRFDGVIPQEKHVLEFVLPAGRIFALAHQAQDELLDSDVDVDTGRTAAFADAENQVDLNWDAGLIPQGIISGVVFDDLDADGVRDDGEPGLPNTYVYIDADADGQWDGGERRVTTDSDGKYILDSLRPGTYAIGETVQSHWSAVKPASGLQSIGLALAETRDGVDFAQSTPIPIEGVSTAGGEMIQHYYSKSSGSFAMAADPLGNYIIVWNDYGTGDRGLYGQWYTREGVARGPMIQVNSNGDRVPGYPSVSVNASGSFVVAWAAYGGSTQEVYARRFAADGTALGSDIQVNDRAEGRQTRPSIVLADNGRFVVAWETDAPSGYGYDIAARLFGPNGQPLASQFTVNTVTDGYQQDVDVAMDAYGNFIVVWEGPQPFPYDNDISGRRFAADGTPMGNEFVINEQRDGWQSYPVVAMDAHGDFVAAWSAPDGSPSGTDIHARRFNASGSPQGSEFCVNTFLAESQTDAAIAMDALGGFVITWSSWAQDGDAYGIYARRFNAAGMPEGEEFRANTATERYQGVAEPAMSRAGDFVVGWIDYAYGAISTLRVQHYALNDRPGVAGGVVWYDSNGDGIRQVAEQPVSGMEVRLVDALGNLAATTLTGSAGDYRFEGVPARTGLRVQFVKPTSVSFSPADQGSDERVDSDADANGLTAVFMLASGQQDLAYGAGLLAQGTIAGTVFNDRDGNGARGGSENDLAGWTVYLDSDADGQLDTGEPSAVTDPMGGYAFSGLAPGAYRVAVGAPRPWMATIPQDGVRTLNLVAGDELEGVDFGYRVSEQRLFSIPLGPAFYIGPSDPGDPPEPDVARGANGAFVATWFTVAADGDSNDVYARLYSAGGVPVGSVFRVNSTLAGEQIRPAAAMDASGNFVIVWQGSVLNQGQCSIFGQRYDATGQKIGGEFRVPESRVDFQYDPDVAMMPAGEFVVAWEGPYQSDTSGQNDIFSRRFHADGSPVGGDLKVSNAERGNRLAPAIAVDSAGDFAVTWQYFTSDEDRWDIYARKYNVSDLPLGDEFRVNSYVTADQTGPAIAMDQDGDFTVVWQSYCQSDMYGIYAQRYSAAAARIGGEMRINAEADGDRYDPAVAMDSAGNLAVTWDGWLPAAEAWTIAARTYSASGQIHGEPFEVSSPMPGQNRTPSIAMGADGDFVIVWASSGGTGVASGIYGRRYQQVPNSASVGGRVWTDSNIDGLRCSEEPFVQGLAVKLLTPEGNVLASAVTDAGGAYRFDGLVPGEQYIVQFARPDRQVFTESHASADDSIDSDVDPLTGRIAFVAAPGQAESAWDAGLILEAMVSGTVFEDVNGNGQRDPGEPGLPGWAVYHDANGNGRWDAGENYASSGADGRYALRALRPGTTIIGLAAEQHWTTTLPASGQRTDVMHPGETAQGFNFAARTSEARYYAVPVGPVTCLTANSTWRETSGVVAVDAAGDYVVAWQQEGVSGYDIYAQRFNPSGQSQGQAFRVNTYVQDGQTRPAIAMDASGDFIIAWASLNQDGSGDGIYAQRFDASGAYVGAEFQVNATTANSQTAPCVALGPDGTFIIAWQSARFAWGDYDIYAQRFDAQGNAVGSEFRANAITRDDQSQAKVAMASDGRFALTWVSYAQGESWNGITTRFYSADGTPLGPEFPVSSDPAGQGQGYAALGMNGSGELVIAWAQTDSSGDRQVWARRFDERFMPQGGNIPVSTHAADWQAPYGVAVGPTGNFVVTWESYDYGYGAQSAIYARTYDLAGRSGSAEFVVSDNSGITYRGPAVAMDGDDGFVVVWNGMTPVNNDYGVYARRYESLANPASLGGVVWNDANNDGMKDPGEAGMEGVVVHLWAGANLYATTTTGSNGDYLFGGLGYGQPYTVEFTRPAGLLFALQDRGGDEALDSDVDIVTGRTGPILLSAGEALLTVHAGVLTPASISGVVFHDRDASGTREQIDSGLANWFVYVDSDADGVRDEGEPTSITGADGRYVLTGLRPGDLRVGVVLQDHWWQTAPVGSIQPVHAAPGENVGGVDFGALANGPVVPATRAGNDIVVNTYRPLDQYHPDVAASATGRFVVVWESWLQDGSDTGVYGQLFNADGSRIGQEFRINDYTVGTQFQAAVAMAPGGSFVVVWTSVEQDEGREGIYARRYGPTGQPLGGEIHVNTLAANQLRDADVAMDAAGDFIITWEHYLTRDDSEVCARRYSADGTPRGVQFQVNTYTAGRQRTPAVAAAADGQFIVTWAGVKQGNGDIYARRFDAAGQAMGDEVRINTWTGDSQVDPAVAMDSAGDFLVAWTSWNQGGARRSIHAQRFNARGVQQGGEFAVNTSGLDTCRPAVAMDADGDFAVSWDCYNQDGNETGIYAHRYNSAGISEGTQFQVNSTAGCQYQSAVAMDASGEVIVTWWDRRRDGPGSAYFTDYSGVVAQRYVPSTIGAPRGHMITPVPASVPVDSLNLVFTTPVTGLDLSDITLTRNGVVVPLGGAQTLTTDDCITWTLGNLTDLTRPAGVYQLTIRAVGSGITNAGTPLAEAVSGTFAITGTRLAATEAGDAYCLKRIGELGVIRVYAGADASGAVVLDVPVGSTSRFIFDALGGDDTLVLDFSGGVPIPAGGVEFGGGAGADRVVIAGNSSAYAVSIDENTISCGDLPVWTNGVEAFGLAGGSMLRLSGLALEPTDTLDLGSGSAIVTHGETDHGAGKVEQLRAWLRSALVGGGEENPWTGKGLTSSKARDDGNVDTAIAIFNNDDEEGNPWIDSFNGIPVDQNTIILKYTYFGDSNADGQITADDFAAVVTGWFDQQKGIAPTWMTGDYDYDGKITADDFALVTGSWFTQDRAHPLNAAVIAPVSIDQSDEGEQSMEREPMGVAMARPGAFAWSARRQDGTVLLVDDLAVFA